MKSSEISNASNNTQCIYHLLYIVLWLVENLFYVEHVFLAHSHTSRNANDDGVKRGERRRETAGHKANIVGGVGTL